MVGSKHGPLHQGLDGYYDQHRNWRPATPMLDDEERQFPETVPDEYLATHRLACGCSPCERHPNQRALRARKRAVRSRSRLRV